MIIARILPHAGMGNQMFMYAAGLSLASRLNTELRLGAWDFEARTSKDRPYCLSCFPAITEPDASFSEAWRIAPNMAVVSLVSRKPFKRCHIFRRAICKAAVKFLPANRTYKPRWVSYSPEFENVPDNTCIIGYWESEKIFAGIKSLVREKFRFAQEYFDPEVSRQVRACNSVALHVRRGDKGERGIGSKEPYIRQAIDKMNSLTENPVYFVFSDGIDWCRENLPKIYDTEYVFVEGQTPPQDMALMSICKHVIMGPSTFSWWGAWLNENPDKIIIAPYVNSQHWMPEDWIKIRVS